jgi:hypothetical protein
MQIYVFFKSKMKIILFFLNSINCPQYAFIEKNNKVVNLPTFAKINK